MSERKRWADLVKRGEWFHLARVNFSPARLSRMHTHDFPEVFWVEQGRGRHVINGQVQILSAGDVVFVRATDTHQLSSADASEFVLVNLAYSLKMQAELVARYEEIRGLHAARTPLPARRQLSEVQIQHLKEEVRRLDLTGRRRMPCERFLLGLYLMVLADSRSLSAALPDWLGEACSAMERPENFGPGVPAFVRLCRRSPEYVARSCRKYLGQTPTEFVNGIRMSFAARELRLGTKPILEICLKCGLENLAHFYALFKAHYAHTPRQYRFSHQQTVI